MPIMKGTVVVSCYNQREYIEDCIQSILNQKTDFDFDILISDDYSTDGTADIVYNYSLQFPEKIKVTLRQVNVGPTRNYLEAHQSTEGDIIFHLDGDDVLLPQKLQKQFDIFKNHSNVNLVFHRAIYFSDDNTYWAETGIPYACMGENLLFDVRHLALWGTIAVHSAYAYRKKSRTIWDINRNYMEWFFAMDTLIPQGQGIYLNEILVKYRCNLSGNAYLASRKGRRKAYKIYLENLLYYFNRYPMLRKSIYANYLVTFLACLKNRNFSRSSCLFLIKHIFYFSFANFWTTYKMRTSIAPSTRIR